MNKEIVEIDGEKIGGNNPLYFIAEGGLNHNGDVKIAKKIIESAKESGASAIKFQTYTSEKFLAESSEYFQFFKNVELSIEEFGELKDHAKKMDITFFSAPFDIESADGLKKLGVPCFKIASSDLTNIPLVKHIAKMNLPMIISTGLATVEEINETVDICYKEGNTKISLLHCIANYPTQIEETNLLAINSLKKKFNIPVGYSDNGESILVDLAAASIGANIIEKHFTLDKKSLGPDHFFSINPKQLEELIKNIRLIETMRQGGEKIPQPSEIKNITAIRKSITASKDIKMNEVLTNDNLSIKRPANGIEPKFLDDVIGKITKKDIRKDVPIQWDCIQE